MKHSSEIIEVPRQAFPGLVEAFLSENYQLWLVVEKMVEKKTFSCREKGCPKSFDAYPLDDVYVIARLEPAEGAIAKVYKCPDGHENTIYWLKEAQPKVFFSTGRR